MPKITFIEFNGTEHVVEAEEGNSVMMTALDNLVPGIDADCGGECSCATCHVIVNDEWMQKVGQPSATEESMLDMNPDRQTNSRLSCQISVKESLDGLVVNLPEFQY
jgi:2Fe-2S ferredoxin